MAKQTLLKNGLIKCRRIVVVSQRVGAPGGRPAVDLPRDRGALALGRRPNRYNDDRVTLTPWRSLLLLLLLLRRGGRRRTVLCVWRVARSLIKVYSPAKRGQMLGEVEILWNSKEACDFYGGYRKRKQNQQVSGNYYKLQRRAFSIRLKESKKIKKIEQKKKGSNY